MTSATGIRSSPLPIEHLEAELVAAPLAFPAAFREALIELDPSLRGKTGALWRDTETRLLGRFPGTSLDELVQRRDRAWFPRGAVAQTAPDPLLLALRESARSMVQAASSVARPRSVPNSGAAAQRRRWRWMTFALPPDLLLACADAARHDAALLSPNLSSVLRERGVAETHLHLGAALRFDTLWASLQRAIAEQRAATEMFASPGAELDNGRELGPWLMRCAWSRLILGSFLAQPVYWAEGLGNYLRELAWPRIESWLGAVAAFQIRLGLQDLLNGHLTERSPAFGALRVYYAAASGATATPRPCDLEEVQQQDPLCTWFPPSPDQHPEFQWMRAGLGYLSSATGTSDAFFARLFWQGVRIRVTYYRHVVQRPLTPGLQWFIRTYGRLKPARRPIPMKALLAGAVQMGGPGLRSLEVRTSPDSNLAEQVRTLRTIDEAATQLEESHDGLEIGVVLHFSRSRGPDATRGRPAAWGRRENADVTFAQANSSGYRYSGYYLERRSQAAALANLLVTFPRMLERVRGVDLCTDELGVPLWVVRPLVQHVRQAAERGARHLRWCESVGHPLRITAHAGEDFVHLIGGLRRIAEVIEFLSLSEGDRIGHGIALGVDPKLWSHRTVSLPVTRGERLMDLVWAWRVAMKSANAGLRTWIPWLHEVIRDLSERVFGTSHPPHSLARLHCDLHNTRALRSVGFPAGPRPAERNVGRHSMVLQWVSDPVVCRHLQETEDVQVADEIELITELQNEVRRLVGKLGLTVELNPSSNLLIGNLSSLEEHPMWRLNAPRPSADSPPPVRICVGSDDPITFATTLPDEYQLLVDAMTESGLSASEAETWVDGVRSDGLASRFTMKRSGIPLTLPVVYARSPLQL